MEFAFIEKASIGIVEASIPTTECPNSANLQRQSTTDILLLSAGVCIFESNILHTVIIMYVTSL